MNNLLNSLPLKVLMFFNLAIIINFFEITANEKKGWTILTYIAGDNDLEPFINLNLKQMKKASNKNVHTLAFVCTKRSGEAKVARKFYMKDNQIFKDGPDIADSDSGIPQTVMQAVEWAHNNYPSDHFALILWDHGSGWRKKLMTKDLNRYINRGVCYDYTTGNNLNDYDIRKILKHAVKVYGKKIDILAFDACLMALLEMAYTVSNYADYLVSSQETIPGTGFNYQYMLEPFKDELLSPEAFSKWMIDAYHKNYSSSLNNDFTLSACKLDLVYKIINNINNLAKKLSELLKYNAYSVKRILNWTQHNSLGFTYNDYKDLASFYTNLYKGVKYLDLNQTDRDWLKYHLLKGLKQLDQCILKYTSSVNLSKARGLSIYFPPNKPETAYSKLYWHNNYPSWYNFLISLARA